MNDITRKIDRLTDLLLEGHINPEVYNKKQVELDLRRRNLGVDINRNNGGDSDFKMAISGIVALLSKSPQLFQSSNIAEKRALLGLVFSNMELKGPTLGFTLRKPLDQFVNLPNCQEWRARRDSNS